MGQSPFAKRPASQGPHVCRRRSSRLDWVTPVILSGRDASGKPFREEAQTTTVNLHGARLVTRQRVLVGMQLFVENPGNGMSEKAICVRIEEPQPGQTLHGIAIQLVTPRNIWGVENPPEDWGKVEADLRSRLVSPDLTKSKAAILPGAPSAASATPAAIAAPHDADSLLAELNRRSMELTESHFRTLREQSQQIAMEALGAFMQRMEESTTGSEARITAWAQQAVAELKSAIETFRDDAMEEIVREATRSFEERLKALVETAEARMAQQAEQVYAELKGASETFRADTMAEIVRETSQNLERKLDGLAGDAEARMTQRADRILADLETALQAFRNEAAEELTARREEVVESTEQALRAKVATMLSSFLGPSPASPAGTDVNPKATQK